MTTRDKYEYDDYGYLHVKKAKVPREYGTLEEMLSAAPTPPEVSGLREVSGVEEVKELAAASGKRTLALLSATPPEVVPAAWMVPHWIRISRGGEPFKNEISYQPWWTGCKDRYVEDENGVKHFAFPLYTAPPSPKAEWYPDGSWLWGQLMDWCKKRGMHPGECNDLFEIVGKAHEFNEKEKKPSWDADGNPLNLEAAARDAYTQMSICGALGEDDYEKALTNLRKFSGES
jgi:hypothetical protein